MSSAYSSVPVSPSLAPEQAKHTSYVIPDDPRIIHDILVPDLKNSGLKPIPKVGDKVVVKMLEWKQRHLNPEGEIIEMLGRTHEPDAEFKAILHKYDLNPRFPSAVEQQTKDIPDVVRSEDIGNRQDCRDLFTFTIDPDDAKDFDDAISLELLEDGKTRVGVHIADVSAYVKPGSAARPRGSRAREQHLSRRYGHPYAATRTIKRSLLARRGRRPPDQDLFHHLQQQR